MQTLWLPSTSRGNLDQRREPAWIAGLQIVHPGTVVRYHDDQLAVVSVELPENVLSDRDAHRLASTARHATNGRVMFGARAPTNGWIASRYKADFDLPWLVPLVAPVAHYLDDIYAEHAPDDHALQRSWVDGLADDAWRLTDGWTSGVVNHREQTLHTDIKNKPGTYNAMFWFRHRAVGGWLAFPNLGIRFPAGHRHALIHDPFALHGVTPVTYDGGHRGSVALYALRGFDQCGTAEDELRRGQVLAT